jgi:hypothetical protein
MADNVKITVDLEKGVISDNRGNKFKKGAGGENIVDRLPEITCDGKKQEINPEVAAKALAAIATGPKSLDPSEYNWQEALKDNSATTSKNMNFWRFSDTNAQALAAVPSLADQIVKSTSSIAATLNEGVPSPLTHLCKVGKESGLLR